MDEFDFLDAIEAVQAVEDQATDAQLIALLSLVQVPIRQLLAVLKAREAQLEGQAIQAAREEFAVTPATPAVRLAIMRVFVEYDAAAARAGVQKRSAITEVGRVMTSTRPVSFGEAFGLLDFLSSEVKVLNVWGDHYAALSCAESLAYVVFDEEARRLFGL